MAPIVSPVVDWKEYRRAWTSGSDLTPRVALFAQRVSGTHRRARAGKDRTEPWQCRGRAVQPRFTGGTPGRITGAFLTRPAWRGRSLRCFASVATQLQATVLLCAASVHNRMRPRWSSVSHKLKPNP